MKQILTHTISIPPLTDITELMAVYNNLFLTLGVKNNLGTTDIATKFTHPVPESNAKLLVDFTNTMGVLTSAVREASVTITNARVTPTALTFVFETGN